MSRTVIRNITTDQEASDFIAELSPDVEAIELSLNLDDDAAVFAVLSLPKASNLHHLAFEGNPSLLVATALKKTLAKLRLSSLKIKITNSQLSIHDLCEVANHPGLLELNLLSTNLRGNGFNTIVRALSPSLRKLDFEANRIACDELEIWNILFGKASQIEEINLKHNRLSRTAAGKIAQLLQTNTRLRIINLEENDPIGDSIDRRGCDELMLACIAGNTLRGLIAMIDDSRPIPLLVVTGRAIDLNKEQRKQARALAFNLAMQNEQVIAAISHNAAYRVKLLTEALKIFDARDGELLDNIIARLIPTTSQTDLTNLLGVTAAQNNQFAFDRILRAYRGEILKSASDMVIKFVSGFTDSKLAINFLRHLDLSEKQRDLAIKGALASGSNEVFGFLTERMDPEAILAIKANCFLDEIESGKYHCPISCAFLLISSQVKFIKFQ